MVTKIYIATHKKYAPIEEKLTSSYRMLFVGANGKEVPYNYTSDDFPSGISYKNPNYCELTGIYYIWKSDQSDIIGLVHYRRVFSRAKLPFFSYKLIESDEIIDALKNHDIILPRKITYKVNMKEQFCRSHNREDYETMMKVIINKYPDYQKAMEEFNNGNFMYQYNMFIAKKITMIPYFEWMFDLLNEVESLVDISKYDNYQKRIFGFLSERLFNIWLIKNKLNVKEINIVEVENNGFIEYCKNVFNRILKRKAK